MAFVRKQDTWGISVCAKNSGCGPFCENGCLPRELWTLHSTQLLPSDFREFRFVVVIEARYFSSAGFEEREADVCRSSQVDLSSFIFCSG